MATSASVRGTAKACASLQCHRGLDRFDALASRSGGLIERGLKPLIGFDQLRVLIGRCGDRRA
jgi:hypothetical protein